MTIRYHITLGAKTTVGGVVTTAMPLFSIDDVPVAHEGDKVACPACKSVGVIQAYGPRLPETTMGRKVALSGDLCICGCKPPPRMVHIQTRCYQELAGDWFTGQDSVDAVVAPQVKSDASDPAEESEDEALILIDLDTDQPHRNRPYRLELQDGVIEGTTDGSGATRPLTPREQASFLQWYVDKDTALE